MRRTSPILIAGMLGAALVTGAAISAAAVTAPTVVVTATPVPTGIPAQPTEQQIRDLFKGWDEALATGDPARVADRYAPDAVLLPTVSNEVRKTPAGIVDYFDHFLEKKPRGTIKDSTVKILGDRDAIDTGVYEFTVTEGGVAGKVEARYTFVYELRDGKWLIVNHHSSQMPEKK
ncbi:SgcJ/EcaC family oxidoreductase [Micromonospora sp. NBC_01699]|uniref:SgcJ/EcaC family oxidoreductase n=1 Tax=Micromonospora sp. NBC_01699 TaxID=2975984 RepID=UPI002E2C39DB|nr:SgcJ/EcaC family oxidoreductase [Micromonospora sp. NBC_01699]